MNIAGLFDPASAAIVVGGTLLATTLRCGLGDCRLALAALGQLGQVRFDADRAKAELAVQVQEIQRDGLLRAQPHHFGDCEFDEVTDRLIGTRSVRALLESHEAHKARRMQADNRAARTLAQAAELAPVFGLAATLISLTQLPADGINRHAYMSAISMAVSATLYGLLLANLVLAPLARAVERAAVDEEAERQKIVDWLARQVTNAMPRHKPALVQPPLQGTRSA
jgi:chemotaxis protein MotA